MRPKNKPKMSYFRGFVAEVKKKQKTKNKFIFFSSKKIRIFFLLLAYSYFIFLKSLKN